MLTSPLRAYCVRPSTPAEGIPRQGSARRRPNDAAMIVDCAYYKDGRRQHADRLPLDGGSRPGRTSRTAGSSGSACTTPTEEELQAAATGLRAARARGRGRGPRPPAAEARGLRQGRALPRPAHGPLPRRRRGGRVRRAAPVHRPGLRRPRASRLCARRWPRRGSGSRRSPSSCSSAPRRSSGRSSTRWSTTTSP